MLLLVKFIKHNQNYYLKLDISTSVLEAFIRLQLSHAYDRFLDMASSCHVKNRKNRVKVSSDEGLQQRSKRQVLGNNFGCVR